MFLPGLNSNAWYVKTAAIFLYTFFLLLSYLSLFVTMEEPGSTLVDGVGGLVQIWIPAAVLFNAGKYDVRRLGMLNVPPFLRTSLRLIFAFAAWLLVAIVFEFFKMYRLC